MSDQDGFDAAQQSYLQGFALGADVARQLRGLPVLSNSAAPSATIRLGNQPAAQEAGATPDQRWLAAQDRQIAMGGKLCAEELAKRTQFGLDTWDAMSGRVAKGEFPKGTDVFLQKFHGLFYVAPAQHSYMCRLRFPGGLVKSYQLRGLADLADDFAGGYVDVTTRANLQLRDISANHPLHIICGLRDLGIINTGAGADNVRNVTASPLGGIDPTELIDTQPLARDMHYYILHHRELYGLPRKFNIAFDGGGTISALEDTNDIGFQAIEIEPEPHGQATRIAFRLLLGGITGHRDFARETDIVAEAEECVQLAAAITRVFLDYGDRTDRKRARLKYLLDDWGLDRFLTTVETEYGPLRRLAANRCKPRRPDDRTAHLGWHRQCQPDHLYVGIALPVGRMTTAQVRGLCQLADRFGRGELRLTVWQNVLLPHIRRNDRERVEEELAALNLEWSVSPTRAGLVACTGKAGCKYAAAHTKQHAMQLATYIDERLDMDQPLNIHLTGCHHSCAQHYIGDIGLIATNVEEGDDLVEGYDIHIGGGYGDRQSLARELKKSVAFTNLPRQIVGLLSFYLDHRARADESFAQFVRRHDDATLINALDGSVNDRQLQVTLQSQ